MKTYTDRRIELGQDINNAWLMVGQVMIASAAGGASRHFNITEEFENSYRAVRAASDMVRKEREAEWEAERQASKEATRTEETTTSYPGLNPVK